MIVCGYHLDIPFSKKFIVICNISLSCPELFYQLKSPAFQILVQAASFGGSNIDPTAWEDKKCKGESRFPAQVKVGLMILRTRLDIHLK